MATHSFVVPRGVNFGAGSNHETGSGGPWLSPVKVKRESEVAQLCPTLSDLMDCSPPGSSVHGILHPD